MLFFLVLDDQNRIAVSPFPDCSSQHEARASFLSPGLPLFYWQQILASIPSATPATKICDLLRQKRELASFSWIWQDVLEQEKLPVFKKGLEDDLQIRFREFAQGKQLTEQELGRAADGLGVNQDTVLRLAAWRVRVGLGTWEPAVTKQGRQWLCQRCGATDIQEWPSIYGPAATCLSCKSLGASTSLSVLYRERTSAAFNHREVQFQPQYNLTMAQQLASAEVLRFVQQDKQRSGLLWAACGAGKTEVCFPAIAWALSQGQRVLYAAPRQDVIHDVAPRLRVNFAQTGLQVLTGVTPFFQQGELVLATTHQVLRFYRFFELVILDEMDAYPYQGSRALAWGLKQAMKEGGKLFCLTATPMQRELDEAKRTNSLIRLPARHHRQPLPVPVWRKLSFSLAEPAEQECPQALAQELRLLGARGPTFLFVPFVSWVEPLVKSLRTTFPEWCIEGSYSADPLRHNKIKDLVLGKYHIFVCTSILERGITVTGAQVMVLVAEHSVFDERALVQMAGRAGRTADNPLGKVLFMGSRPTRAVKTAISWIEEQNSISYRLGLIDK